MKTKERSAEIIRLSSKGQLTIPSEYRDKIHLNLGDYLSIYDVGNKFLVIEKANPTPLSEIVKALDKEVKKTKFKRKELSELIKKARKEVYKEKYGD